MPSWIARETASNPNMTAAEQENNVLIIAQYFRGLGWSDNAISALCGNMEIESYLNPCQFEIRYNFSPSYGFGLVQWTPRTKFSDWAGSDWRTNYNKQLQRIKYELDNGLQWIPVSAYNYMTFAQFSVSTQTPEYLVMAFEYSYERGTPMTAQREAAARKWYTFLGNNPTGNNIPIWMLFKIQWNNRLTRG